MSYTEKIPIYTTGAKIVPEKVIINNQEKWVWIVIECMDDCFDNEGKICIPNLDAQDDKTLIVE